MSFFTKMKERFRKASSKITGGVEAIAERKVLDDAALEELEDLLIQADLGVNVAMRASAAVAEGASARRSRRMRSRGCCQMEIARIVDPVAKPLPLYPDKKPQVILVVGVNGAGKTTTIGKLAAQLKGAGKSVVVAAGDTFRAAAIEATANLGRARGRAGDRQGSRLGRGGRCLRGDEQAAAMGADILMIDTAGRLQNRSDLMGELEKIVRVIRKRDETAPHNTLLVLDATVGQNAISQADIFSQVADVSGLIMTKMDGTAKGGVLVALADKFGLPIHAIGGASKWMTFSPSIPKSSPMP